VHLPYGAFYAALDAAKAADYVLLVLSPDVEVSAWGDTLLRALQAQGLPTVVAACAAAGPADAKARAGVLKSLLSFVQYFVPDHARVLDLAAHADALGAARALCEGRPAEPKWRDARARVLVEEARWDAAAGQLALTGVVRGGPLSADRLVHLPDHGDYQIAKARALVVRLGSATADAPVPCRSSPRRFRAPGAAARRRPRRWKWSPRLSPRRTRTARTRS
jgi:pre-rRNA-processing protein TSR1